MFCGLIIISCVLLTSAATDCPACPSNPYPCHSFVNYGQPCPCSLCLTKCDVRKPVCKKGEVCATEDLYFGKNLVGQTAVCKPFVQCPQVQCPKACPESGYFVDQNGCTTCLCSSPCQELKCPGSCGATNIYPGTEPNFQCQ